MSYSKYANKLHKNGLVLHDDVHKAIDDFDNKNYHKVIRLYTNNTKIKNCTR